MEDQKFSQLCELDYMAQQRQSMDTFHYRKPNTAVRLDALASLTDAANTWQSVP
jgi:hypothetical protein